MGYELDSNLKLVMRDNLHMLTPEHVQTYPLGIVLCYPLA